MTASMIIPTYFQWAIFGWALANAIENPTALRLAIAAVCFAMAVDALIRAARDDRA